MMNQVGGDSEEELQRAALEARTKKQAYFKGWTFVWIGFALLLLSVMTPPLTTDASVQFKVVALTSSALIILVGVRYLGRARFER